MGSFFPIFWWVFFPLRPESGFVCWFMALIFRREHSSLICLSLRPESGKFLLNILSILVGSGFSGLRPPTSDLFGLRPMHRQGHARSWRPMTSGHTSNGSGGREPNVEFIWVFVCRVQKPVNVKEVIHGSFNLVSLLI